MIQGDAGLEALQPQIVPEQLTWQLIGIEIECDFVHTHQSLSQRKYFEITKNPEKHDLNSVWGAWRMSA